MKYEKEGLLKLDESSSNTTCEQLWFTVGYVWGVWFMHFYVAWLSQVQCSGCTYCLSWTKLKFCIGKLKFCVIVKLFPNISTGTNSNYQNKLFSTTDFGRECWSLWKRIIVTFHQNKEIMAKRNKILWVPKTVIVRGLWNTYATLHWKREKQRWLSW